LGAWTASGGAPHSPPVVRDVAPEVDGMSFQDSFLSVLRRVF